MSKARFQVAVVIPAFKQPGLVRAAAESLLTIDFPEDQFEAVVVDSSPDDTNERIVNEIAARARFRLRCIRKQPEGPGPSRNLGVAHTDSVYIAFMDSDCMATPGWLRAGVAAFEEGIGIVQGRTLPDPSGTPTSRTWYLKVEQETPYYETANVFYRRTAFEESGGFPGDLHPTHDKHMGGEDVVAAWNVIRKGWKTRFCSEALVYHALVTLPLLSCFFIKHLYVVPWLIRDFPELRRFMYARYFLSRDQCLIFMVLIGVIAALVLHPGFLLLLAPYIAIRFWEPATSMSGILRPVRLVAHMTRDVLTFGILLTGSLRFGCLLL